jgi:uncharacterized protein YjiS (DUF1127 family)
MDFSPQGTKAQSPHKEYISIRDMVSEIFTTETQRRREYTVRDLPEINRQRCAGIGVPAKEAMKEFARGK